MVQFSSILKNIMAALHDIDKTNSTRSNPMPNSHDMQNILRPAHGTTSFNPVTDATDLTTAPTFTGNFRVVKTGTATMPIATATTSTTTLGFGSAETIIPHNLSYAPIVIAWATGIVGVNQSVMLPYNNTSGSAATALILQQYYIIADSTNIYLESNVSSWTTSNQSRSDSSAPGVTVLYYLLQETAK